MSSDNIPLSEVFRQKAEEWVDLEAAAQLLEDTKSSVLAQKCSMLGDMAVNKAEQTIKASADWQDHLAKIVEARRLANRAKMELDYIKMRFSEHQSQEANERTMARL